jgi:hypothetical protein
LPIFIDKNDTINDNINDTGDRQREGYLFGMYQNLVLFLSPFNTLLGVLTIDQTLKCQTEVLTFVPDLTYPVLGYDFEFENV